MSLSEKVRPVVLATALGVSYLTSSVGPVSAHPTQRDSIPDHSETRASQELSEADRILEIVRPSLYKLKYTPTVPWLSNYFCTGWAKDDHTLVTAYHCGREVWRNNRIIQTIDSNGYPLYTITAYQDRNMTTGKWDLTWVPPPVYKPPYANNIDIGILRSEKPFATHLEMGDTTQLTAGQNLTIAYYNWDSDSPFTTTSWLIDGSHFNLLQATGNAGRLSTGASGAPLLNSSAQAVGTQNYIVHSSERSRFLHVAGDSGIANDPGVKALIQTTSIEGIKLLGY